MGTTCVTPRPGFSRRAPHVDLTRVAFQVILAIFAAGFFVLVPPLHAQTSPLTIQPSTGRVGIGTTLPSERLSIMGNIEFRDGTYAHLADVKYGASGQEGNLQFWTRTGGTAYERMRIVSSGNVGIGTTNPGYKLEVVGDAYIRGAGSTDRARIRFNYINGTIQAGKDSSGAGVDAIVLSGNGGRDDLAVNYVGNVGIGTTAPTSKLQVVGTLTATTKNFQIDHPLDPGKKFLVHSALEGPETAVYYRGEAQLQGGEAVIPLPAYFEALTRLEGRTVQLTPIKGWSPLYVAEEIWEGRFTVRTSTTGNPAQRFYWEVKAVRADVDPLVVERTK